MSGIRTPNSNNAYLERKHQPVIAQLKQKLAIQNQPAGGARGANQPIGRLGGANNANANFTLINRGGPVRVRGNRIKFPRVITKALGFKATKDGRRPASPEVKKPPVMTTDVKTRTAGLQLPAMQTESLEKADTTTEKGFQRWVKHRCVNIKPRRPTTKLLTSKQRDIKVEVQFKSGKLQDPKNTGGVPVNVVRPGNVLETYSKLGINNVKTNAPVFMFLKKEGGVKLIGENVNEVTPKQWRDRIDDNEKQGYKFDRIVVGRHEMSSPTQEKTILELGKIARDRGISFRVIDLKNQGKGSLWMTAQITEDRGSIEVPPEGTVIKETEYNQKVTINVGSDLA